MNRTRLIATVSLALALITTMITSNQLSTYASPTTEDDGYTYPDDANEEEKEEIDEQEQEAWEDAGRPGDNDNNDDNSNNDLPRCAYGVVQDCTLNDLGQTCEVGTGEDVCQDVFYGYGTGEFNGHKRGEIVDTTKKDTSSSSDNDNDIPECQNGVTHECVISEISLKCKPGYDLSNPDIVGGGHACQDIYAGIYKPQP